MSSGCREGERGKVTWKRSWNGRRAIAVEEGVFVVHCRASGGFLRPSSRCCHRLPSTLGSRRVAHKRLLSLLYDGLGSNFSHGERPSRCSSRSASRQCESFWTLLSSCCRSFFVLSLLCSVCRVASTFFLLPSTQKDLELTLFRFQVMRYTGLVGGIAYGAYYQYSLQKQADREAWEAQKRKRERWVRQARKIYQEKYGKPTGRALSFVSLARTAHDDAQLSPTPRTLASTSRSYC